MRILAPLGKALAIACLVSFAPLSTANEVTPSWTIEFHVPVEWQRVTSMGDLIVSTRTGLYGVEPVSGKIAWHHADLDALPAGSFREVAGAPLFMIHDGRADERLMILNAVDGTVVFDSKETRLTDIRGKYVMPRSNGLLIVGFEKDNFDTQLFMYDLNTGKQRWHNSVLSADMAPMMSMLMAVAQVAMDVDPIHAHPVELEDGSFLLSAMGQLHRLDAASGSVIWKQEVGAATVLHQSVSRPGVVYAGIEEGDGESSPNYFTIQALDIEAGRQLWNKPKRYRGALNPLIIDTDRGLIVSEHTQGSGKIRLLDYDSGASRWGKKGKGIKVKGGIVDYDFTNSGLLVTTGYDSAWNDKGTEYLLYVLDPASGEPRFKNPLKVKGRMVRTELLEQGLMFVTTHEVNVFNPATGALLHDPVVRSKRPIVAGSDGNLLYAFNADSGLLYRLDRGNAGLTAVSTAKLKLEGKDSPTSLDVRGGNIVLTGHQSVVGFNEKGDTRFNTYHPPPKRHAVVQALLWAQAVRATMASVQTGVTGAAFAAAGADAQEGSVAREITTEVGDEFTGASEQLAGIAGDYAREARRRFQASAVSRDFVFMMIQSGKEVAIAQVSKNDGAVVAEINLGKDKEPSYQVDDVSERIFYRQTPSSIVGYDFAPATTVSQSR